MQRQSRQMFRAPDGQSFWYIFVITSVNLLKHSIRHNKVHHWRLRAAFHVGLIMAEVGGSGGSRAHKSVGGSWGLKDFTAQQCLKKNVVSDETLVGRADDYKIGWFCNHYHPLLTAKRTLISNLNEACTAFKWSTFWQTPSQETLLFDLQPGYSHRKWFMTQLHSWH